ncbi:MAG: GAF domain-containing sensor histidine kinase [Pelolinea sp.]|jgi:signal transduction histidine kinase|nr:GAF domain-containing sensor histidine kinase [Pelolinea sp.]
MQGNNHDFEEREQQRKARFRVGSNGVSTPFILEYLERVLPTTLDFLNFSDAELYLKKEKSLVLLRVLHYGESKEFFWKEEQQELGKSTLGKIAQMVEPCVLDLNEEQPPDLNQRIVRSGFHSIHCFPIRAESGVLGVLCLADKKIDVLDEKVRDVLMGTAAVIGAVVYHERKSLEAKRTIVMEERERIGMDLHDGIIQSLYGVGLSLQNAMLQNNSNETESKQHIDDALDAINDSIRDIRAYILDLRPRQLRNQDLYMGIESLIREFRANTLVDVELEKDIKHIERIPDESSEILFHVCQEALANIAKHAKATKVNVRLWETPQRVMLKVNDDGVGFDLAKINQRLGHGLSNMTTRVEAVGGGIEIISIRHQGTTVLAWVPNNLS